MMRTKRVLVICALLICCFTLSGCFGGQERPRGELLQSIPSPDGKHVMNVYRSSGGATVDWSTTVSVTDAAEGKERNIYYHYHEYEPESVAWLDNKYVQINAVRLNIHTDYFESFEQ